MPGTTSTAGRCAVSGDGPRRASRPGRADEASLTPSSTPNGGQPADSVDNSPEPVDPARAALEAARALARGRPRPRRAGGRRAPASSDPRPRGGYSGAHADDTDPQPVGRLFAEHVGERGWRRPLNEARLFTDWPAIVGPEVAAHCAPTALRDGELRITAQSSAWATQLRLLAATLLAQIVAEVGADVVRRVVVTGPAAPSWRHGRWSVPGARGPRDTYG
ncbi:MAG: DUF721 domain-containing protein [Jatrophihabitans sp.]|nr:MAG: DUF721 domain-containing protein [Jatrophihabitans sp.]